MQAIFAFGGFCQASLTGEGRLYVEEEQGFVKQIHESPQHYFLNVSGSNNQVVVGVLTRRNVQQHMTVEESRRPAFSVLDEIEETLNKDSTLEPASKADLLADLDAVRKRATANASLTVQRWRHCCSRWRKLLRSQATSPH